MTRLPMSMGVSMATLADSAAPERLAAAGIRYLCVPPQFYDQEEALVWETDARLRACGLVIDTCHPPFGGGNHPNSLCAEDEAVREATVATYLHYIRAFALTGVRAIPVHTGGAMHPAGGKKALERLTDTLRRLLPAAKESGVILALENTFYENPCPFSDAPRPSGVDAPRINDDCPMLAAYVREWADPNIRVCHDAGHSLLYGHALRPDLEALAPLTVLYHIHDNDGVQDCHWNVGEGVFPWEEFAAFVREQGHPWPLFNEVLAEKTPGSAPADPTKRVIAYYRAADAVLNGPV